MACLPAGAAADESPFACLPAGAAAAGPPVACLPAGGAADEGPSAGEVAAACTGGWRLGPVSSGRAGKARSMQRCTSMPWGPS